MDLERFLSFDRRNLKWTNLIDTVHMIVWNHYPRRTLGRIESLHVKEGRIEKDRNRSDSRGTLAMLRNMI